jgi:hypothetical protein
MGDERARRKIEASIHGIVEEKILSLKTINR